MASYKHRLNQLCLGVRGFAARRAVFLNDRYGASHFLQPVLDNNPTAFFTNGDDESLQLAWAQEQGLKTRKLDDILLAQIEAHRTEVFYNLDPIRYDGAFVRRLPGHVRRKIAWRAAPGSADFTGYDLIVSNFPSILARYREDGFNTAEFFPAHDPELDAYAANDNRDIDVLFIGGYSRHHARRSELLQTVAALRDRYNIVFHLDRSRVTRLAETPLGLLPPLARHRRPSDVQAVSHPPVFGRDMYQTLSRAKIVVNMAIDMAGTDRGNMRCFEAMGARALLLSDEGLYPAGMEDGSTMTTYSDIEDTVKEIEQHLHESTHSVVAQKGWEMIKALYNKPTQLTLFNSII
jgi:hypothetical protein